MAYSFTKIYKGALLQGVTADPAGTTVDPLVGGQLWFRSDLNTFKFYNGTTTQTVATTGSTVASVNTLVGAVTLAAGANITLTPAGNTITIASSGSGVTTLNTLSGAVVLAAGTGITLTPVGNTITIDSTGSGANAALSNLASVGINTDLIFNAGGAAAVKTKNAASTDNLSIKSGDASGGNSGNVVLQPGTATGTRGSIVLSDASIGTAGHVWTSTDTAGTGGWAAPQTHWVKYTVDHTDPIFNVASTSAQKTLVSLTTNQTILTTVMKHSAAFSGAGIVNCVFSVGSNVNSARFIGGIDLVSAPGFNENHYTGTTSAAAFVCFDTTEPIYLNIVATGANLDQVYAGTGSVDIWFLISEIPAATP